MLAIFYRTVNGTETFEVIREQAQYFATAIITCFGFLTAKHLHYAPRNWVEFQGPASKIVVGRFESFREPPLDHADNDTFKKIAILMPLILNNPPLARALDDYYSCLSKTNPDFYVYAYRAVEDIRSHFGASEEDDERKTAWENMNKALNHNKKDYAELVKFAKEYRHANKLGESIDPETAQRQVTFVASLIDAFVKYLSSPVPSS
jgi:hypothetical protein